MKFLLLLASAFTLAASQAPAFFPFFEVGFNFRDHDISHAPGTSAADCATKCLSVGNCKAVTFTSFPPVCWFKTGRFEVDYWPGVVSTVLWPTPPLEVCKPRKDVDFVDNDIGNQHASTVAACCEICRHFPRCRAYAWNNANGGTCWLKSKRGKVIFKPGVWAADAFPNDHFDDPGHDPRLIYGVDFVNNDIGSVPAGAPSACFDICTNFGGCGAFSWSGFQGGTCWLKSEKGATVDNAGVVSGVVAVVPPPQCKYEADGLDYQDNDIGSKNNVQQPKQCCALCKAFPNCKAFAWSDYQGGTCWFKSAKGVVVAKAGVKAGWVKVTP